MENHTQVKVAKDLRQGEKYGRYIESIGWKVIKTPVTKTGVFIRKLGPVSLVKVQRFNTLPKFMELNEIYKKFHVVMCKLEPSENINSQDIDKLKDGGFKPSSWPLLATKTLRINLRPSEEKILSAFRKDCRYCIRRAESQKGLLKVYNEFDKFYMIWKQSAKRKNLWIPGHEEYLSLIKSFGDSVYCITLGNLSGAVILIYQQVAYYYYAGSTTEGVKKDLPYAVVWEAIKEAKRRGCTIWDFEGIFDARWPNKAWLGFSHFKKSFGGEEIEFPGSFEKWRWPF